MGKSTEHWKRLWQKDIYVRQAQAAGYRSRASFKLIQLDDKYKLLKNKAVVVDLGAAPGGWSQVASARVGAEGLVLACDLLPMPPLTNIEFVQGDFSTEAVRQTLLKMLKGKPPDLVLSDMAPNLSGIRLRDQAAGMALAQHALDFAIRCLRPGGHFIVKVFQGDDLADWATRVKEAFKQVNFSKPKSSKDASRELYIVARYRKLSEQFTVSAPENIKT